MTTAPAPLDARQAQGHSAQARAVRDERRTQVAAMLVAHTTTRRMAELLGVHHASIQRDVAVIRRYWRERAALDYGTRVAEELATLEELSKAFMPKARAGDPRAAEQIRWIMERRARLIGLDAPIRTKVEGTVTVEEAEPKEAALDVLDELTRRRQRTA